jgi:hypothetical protein
MTDCVDILTQAGHFRTLLVCYSIGIISRTLQYNRAQKPFKYIFKVYNNTDPFNLGCYRSEECKSFDFFMTFFFMAEFDGILPYLIQNVYV